MGVRTLLTHAFSHCWVESAITWAIRFCRGICIGAAWVLRTKVESANTRVALENVGENMFIADDGGETTVERKKGR